MRRLAVCAVLAPISLSILAAAGAEQDEHARVRAAAGRSVALLQAHSRTWIGKAACASCHSQVLPAVAFAIATTRGLHVDETIVRDQTRVLLARWERQREGLYQSEFGDIANVVFNAGYALLGLAAANVVPNATTDAMVHFISTRQMGDGRFRSNSLRPPLEYSDVTATALAIHALARYAPSARKEETSRVVRRARDWLLSTHARGTEEQSFQLRGLVWSGADVDEIARRAVKLQQEQRPDGGWAQLPDLASDAYATGQALVSLHAAGRLRFDSGLYQRGVLFLLNTQLDDGSWHVRSRAGGAQPYFESGFPHGTDQFISAAGTAWAATALLLSLDSDAEKNSVRLAER